MRPHAFGHPRIAVVQQALIEHRLHRLQVRALRDFLLTDPPHHGKIALQVGLHEFLRGRFHPAVRFDRVPEQRNLIGLGHVLECRDLFVDRFQIAQRFALLRGNAMQRKVEHVFHVLLGHLQQQHHGPWLELAHDLRRQAEPARQRHDLAKQAFTGNTRQVAAVRVDHARGQRQHVRRIERDFHGKRPRGIEFPLHGVGQRGHALVGKMRGAEQMTRCGARLFDAPQQALVERSRRRLCNRRVRAGKENRGEARHGRVQNAGGSSIRQREHARAANEPADHPLHKIA